MQRVSGPASSGSEMFTVPSNAGRKAGVTQGRPAIPRAKNSKSRSRRWGVILAGGDGSSLRSLTRFICGDDRPKQFCSIFGPDTLLEQARRRAERVIPAEQMLFALTRVHEEHYLRDLSHTHCQRLVQPCNRGTAPPILYGLLQIGQADPDAIVAILPCDHYYSDENAFARALNSAFETASFRPASVVLLGAQPNAPEVEYGWIEVGAAVRKTVFQVRGFHEKPPLAVAERLLGIGALWNTFVMVGHVQAFLEMSCASIPGLVEIFQSALTNLPASRETRIPDALYEWVYPSDFSRHVLSAAAKRLVTMRLAEVEWHDLGHPDRVLSTLLGRNEEPPSWLRAWQAANNNGPLSKVSLIDTGQGSRLCSRQFC